MDEYCPLCHKVGNYKKIRAIQVNHDEAVWLCEEEKCPWPFGYEEFKFIPRRIEELSKKTYSRTETGKNKEATAISTELGVYTPPVTPSNESSSKDSGKLDNLGVTTPSTISSPFTGKISPTYRSRAVLTHQPIKQESPQESNEKFSNPVSSIFDIDSSVPVGKIGIAVMKQGTGPSTCDGNRGKHDFRSKIVKRKMTNVPQIRSIETIPNNLIKIEVKEDLATNLVTPTVKISPSKGNCEANRCVTSPPRGPPLPETNELENFDSMPEVPKKILKLSDDEIEEKPGVDQLSDQMLGDNLLQSSDYLEMMNFEGGNDAMDSSGQVGLSGIFEELLVGNFQNVTQEIDDDWLKSMLI
ncbi:uncharacterized protein LOC107045132 [Diachasma alloeum]|uniref:uncharacterized protein LOC107045132 n=1 Tax=Diachasma alloeum TaxID=454923 RepID=UPI00073849CD|nr:uncharacterized protein LOC107045132 [Diachasma alloeum]